MAGEGVKIGRYMLFDAIASGGMASVHLGRMLGLAGFARTVAIKRLHPHLSRDPEFAAMFLEEAHLAARVRHPNVVPIFDVELLDGELLLVMEYVRGESLSKLVRLAHGQTELVPRPIVASVVSNALYGLAAAHEATAEDGTPLAIVHRDVSPQNVLVGADGVVRVVDFGVAKAASSAQHTAPGVVRGKLAYMAPEQITRGVVDGRADLYAVGVILWELLSGRRLFTGSDADAVAGAVVSGRIPPLASIAPDVPASLSDLVQTAVAHEPERRFASAREMADALSRALVPAAQGDVAAFVERVASAELAVRDALLTRIESSAPSGPARGRVRGEEVRSTGHRQGNITPATTSFLGREAELARLRDLTNGGDRLVTLVGPAGTGKTRLATRFAELHVNEFASGAWFCDLTDARDSGAVCAVVARTLGVPLASVETSAEAVARLGAALATRGSILLVLDNCEQAIEAVADAAAAWRSAAPSSVLVATSREMLHVPGERVYEVPPLSVPRGDDDVTASEAVQLFLERASLVRPGYSLTDANRRDLATVVRSLDGLPLAIELAAARMGLLGARDLVALLPRRFELLSGGPREASERQRTLRGAIEWSWNLLEPWEKAALAQSAVFRGGFSLAAAEAVLSIGVPGAPPLLDVLQSLRDKSLLRVQDDEGEARFGFYESIRELASEKLHASDDAKAVMQRHLAYFLSASAALAEGVDGAGGGEKLRRLAREEENLLAAHAHALDRLADDAGAGEDALRIVLALEALYTARGPMTRAVSLLDTTLGSGATDGASAAVVARALLARALVGRQELSSMLGAGALGDFDATFGHAEKALAAARAAGDVAAEVDVLCSLGALEVFRGRSERGRAHAESAARLASSTNDRRLRGRCLFVLGAIDLFEGAHDDALERLSEAREQLQRADDLKLEGFALVALGVVLQERGRLDEAQLRFEQALGRFRELGRSNLQGYVRGHLAGLHHERWQLDEAQGHYEAAVALLDDTAEPSASYFRAGLGAVLAARGDGPTAARLLDQAESAIARSNLPAFLLAAVRVHRAHLDLTEARARVAEATPFAANSDEVRLALRIVERALAQRGVGSRPAANALVVARDGRELRTPDGRVVDLRRRPRLRRLLLALVEARVAAPGRAQGVDALFAVAWRGERATHASSRQRVYTAIGALRDLGLRSLLLNDVEGYLLDPEISVIYADPDDSG